MSKATFEINYGNNEDPSDYSIITTTSDYEFVIYDSGYYYFSEDSLDSFLSGKTSLCAKIGGDRVMNMELKKYGDIFTLCYEAYFCDSGVGSYFKINIDNNVIIDLVKIMKCLLKYVSNNEFFVSDDPKISVIM